jgi:5-methylcytosine-specific restriction enzyme A
LTNANLLHVVKNVVTDAAHSLGLTSRSTQWPRVRKAWLKDHPTCAACGSIECIQVHHKKPFHDYPELELDPKNFITLCERRPVNDHLEIGHLGNWKDFNTNVESDAHARLINANRRTTS